MDFAHYWFGGGGDNPIPFPIGESLRFRGGSYSWVSRMTREQTTSGSQTTATYSYWTKAPQYGNARFVFYGGSSAANHLAIACNGSHGEGGNNSIDNPLLDESAWYHIVQVWDTTNANTNDTLRHYVNGVRQTWSGGGTASGNMKFGRTGSVTIGGAYNSSGQWASDAYTLAEFHFIDGQALDPDGVFGEFNADGVWVPIRYSGTYGGNGWYLDFSDPNNIGADRSGNGNNFTPAGFELSNTSSIDYDWLADSPTANTSTLNPLFRSNTVPTYSTTRLSVSGATTTVEGTHGVSEGKWYYECIMTGGGSQIVGICGPKLSKYSGNLYDQSTAYTYQFQGNKGHNGSLSSYGASYGNNDVIGVAFDADAGSITFYKNGTSQGVAFTGISGTFLPAVSNNGNAATHNLNFGQQPFRHTPPAGFEPWSTAEMPDVAITNPSEHFRAVTYAGTNGTQSITGVGFQPDLVWLKNRSLSSALPWQDSLRGPTAFIFSCYSDPENENTSKNWFRSFDSDGFTVSADSGIGQSAEWNWADSNFVAWCWNAGDGNPVTNTNGTVNSTVKANQEAGFSIVTWGGNTTNNTRVGHGLSRAPELIILKSRNNNTDWPMYVEPMGISKVIYLNHNYDQGNAGSGAWGSEQQPPNATVFSVGTSTETNNGNMVAYCWHSVPGFSSIGSYVGNGNNNGTFVYTGFRPAFVMTKMYTGADNWNVYDNARGPYNPNGPVLYPDLTNQEDNLTNSLDFLSNGFKLHDYANNSGASYLYVAFAEHPFGGGNVAPSPAR